MLHVDDLHFAYGRTEVLPGVSLEVQEGEIVCLIGPNGAGKSTLLNVISRGLDAGSGAVVYRGEAVTKVNQAELVRRGLILVPEGRQVFGSLSVEDNLRLGMYVNRRTSEYELLVDSVFDMFPRLKERSSQLAGTLSGGEQQMLAIGRALMGSPKLMLLDEPSLGLAPKITSQIMENLQQLRERGLTILLVEQNARMALSISDRGYLLNGGLVHAAGTSSDLLENELVQKVYLGGG
ncbi:ABC transporter ATP-binding protein [Specibacter sp. RAF43]